MKKDDAYYRLKLSNLLKENIEINQDNRMMGFGSITLDSATKELLDQLDTKKSKSAKDKLLKRFNLNVLKVTKKSGNKTYLKATDNHISTRDRQGV